MSNTRFGLGLSVDRNAENRDSHNVWSMNEDRFDVAEDVSEHRPSVKLRSLNIKSLIVTVRTYIYIRRAGYLKHHIFYKLTPKPLQFFAAFFAPFIDFLGRPCNFPFTGFFATFNQAFIGLLALMNLPSGENTSTAGQ